MVKLKEESNFVVDQTRAFTLWLDLCLFLIKETVIDSCMHILTHENFRPTLNFRSTPNHAKNLLTQAKIL